MMPELAESNSIIRLGMQVVGENEVLPNLSPAAPFPRPPFTSGAGELSCFPKDIPIVYRNWSWYKYYVRLYRYSSNIEI